MLCAAATNAAAGTAADAAAGAAADAAADAADAAGASLRRLVLQVLQKRGGFSDLREAQVWWVRALRRDGHITNAAADLRRLVL